MDDHFRIGGGRKHMAALLQLSAEVAKVVDLTVKHHPNPAVLVVDRLASGLQINDAQAAHTQAHALVPSEIEPLIVGAPMDERRAHRAQLFQRDRLPLETHYSRNAAHRLSSSDRSGDRQALEGPTIRHRSQSVITASSASRRTRNPIANAR